ncbi:hypothetical protein [Mycolicibacterium sp.]|uniref:hypothetical protein n=1 Tax=Mycolicibacterium sp. TaxID=2320850 RepID=UPI0035606EC7
MSSHGWTNDSTWGVAGACDNTEAFAPQLQQILTAARAGDPETAARDLQEAVQARNVLGSNLANWVTLGEVNWRELIDTWAADG